MNTADQTIGISSVLLIISANPHRHRQKREYFTSPLLLLTQSEAGPGCSSCLDSESSAISKQQSASARVSVPGSWWLPMRGGIGEGANPGVDNPAMKPIAAIPIAIAASPAVSTQSAWNCDWPVSDVSQLMSDLIEYDWDTKVSDLTCETSMWDIIRHVQLCHSNYICNTSSWSYFRSWDMAIIMMPVILIFWVVHLIPGNNTLSRATRTDSSKWVKNAEGNSNLTYVAECYLGYGWLRVFVQKSI